MKKQEAAAYFGMSERWLREQMEQGTIPFHKFGRAVRFHVRDLDAYAEAHRVDASR